MPLGNQNSHLLGNENRGTESEVEDEVNEMEEEDEKEIQLFLKEVEEKIRRKYL